jgi:hypothetical protein
MLHKHGSGNGITTSAVFRCGCRGRKPDGGSRANTAHVTTFVSRQIRDLEEEVGAKLLTRTARGIRLTPAGRASLDHARLVLSQVEAAAQAARRVAHPAKPCFVMGFLTGHESTWMPEAMQILARRTAEHRRDDIEPILAAARECSFEGNRRCGFSSKGTRAARLGIPCSHQGGLGGGLAE